MFTNVGVTLVRDHKAVCRSSTNAMERADAALTGLSNGENTLRTRRPFVEQRSVR